jgi:hypothetical protein
MFNSSSRVRKRRNLSDTLALALISLWENTMNTHVGLVASLKNTCVCVVDQDASIVSERSVVSDPEAIAIYAQSCLNTPRV